MEVVHPRCAGLDVSKRDAKVCVRLAGSGRAAARSTVTTWGAVTNQVVALREHLLAQRVTLVVTGGHGRLLEAVLLSAGGRPVRGDAGQRPACHEPAGSQE